MPFVPAAYKHYVGREVAYDDAERAQAHAANEQFLEWELVAEVSEQDCCEWGSNRNDVAYFNHHHHQTVRAIMNNWLKRLLAE